MHLGIIVAVFGLIITITGYNSNTSGPIFLGVASILTGILLVICFYGSDSETILIFNPEPKD